MTQPELIARLNERLSKGLPTAVVTLTGAEGSVPRELGAKMLVLPDGSIEGTIGGGRLEAEAIRHAAAALAEGRAKAVSFELEPKTLGMYCGGRADLFIDVYGAALKLVVLGGGHVGRKTAELACFLGLPHSLVDDRPEFSRPQDYPRARAVMTSQPDAALKSLGVDQETAVVIVTRCHGFDLRCLTAALQTPAFYVGMIGSRTKTERLFMLCRRRGLDPDQERVRAPIGLDLGGRSPEMIALSILSEVLMLRHSATGLPLCRRPAEAST